MQFVFGSAQNEAHEVSVLLAERHLALLESIILSFFVEAQYDGELCVAKNILLNGM